MCSALIVFCITSCASEGDKFDAQSFDGRFFQSAKKVCRPIYSQVYQPPLKLGGAGRVIQVNKGQECVTKEQDECEMLRTYTTGSSSTTFGSKWIKQNLSVASYYFPNKSFHNVQNTTNLKRVISESSKFSKYDFSLVGEYNDLKSAPVHADINIVFFNSDGLQDYMIRGQSYLVSLVHDDAPRYAFFGLYNTLPRKHWEALVDTSSEVLTGRISHFPETETIHRVWCNIPTDVNADATEDLLRECFLRSEGFPGSVKWSATHQGRSSHFHVKNNKPLEAPKYSDGIELIRMCSES